MGIRLIGFAALIAAAPLAAQAQAGRLELPSFAGIEKKANQAVDISLDGPMLELAGRFMSEEDPGEASSKKLIIGLRGIYVRSYQFDAEHVYSKADVDAVRAQVARPGWVRVVSVRKDEHDVDIYLRPNGKLMDGLAIIASEPRAFTIVNIVGTIDLEGLRRLEGKFGVPKLDLGQGSPPSSTP